MVDDVSPDDTVGIAKKYADKVTRIKKILDGPMPALREHRSKYLLKIVALVHKGEN